MGVIELDLQRFVVSMRFIPYNASAENKYYGPARVYPLHRFHALPFSASDRAQKEQLELLQLDRDTVIGECFESRLVIFLSLYYSFKSILLNLFDV